MKNATKWNNVVGESCPSKERFEKGGVQVHLILNGLDEKFKSEDTCMLAYLIQLNHMLFYRCNSTSLRDQIILLDE